MNIEEDMHKLYHDINPDRVKFLQMLPSTDFAEKQKVSDDDFDFVLNFIKDKTSMNYRIVEMTKDNASEFARVNTLGWVESYKGIIDQNFLDKINTFILIYLLNI